MLPLTIELNLLLHVEGRVLLRLGNFPARLRIGSFRFDYEYEIRQAKRMLYAYAIPYWREKVVAVAHLSTKLSRNHVVLTTTFQKNKEIWLFLFSKNNL
jgi:hypothetical protein